jgi:hypothetical protein
MSKDALVSEDLAQKFATEKETPYTRWVKSEGLDIISAHYVKNLNTVDLKPWARRGGKGVFINHERDTTCFSNPHQVGDLQLCGLVAVGFALKTHERTVQTRHNIGHT